MLPRWLFAPLLLTSLIEGAPLTLTGISGLDPSAFRVTTFASGLNFPTSMIAGPNGSLLAGVAGGGTFNFATGALVRFSDPLNTGMAGPGVTVYSGLPGSVVSVRQLGDMVVAASSVYGLNQTTISFLRPGADPDDPYTLAGSIQLAHTRIGGNSNALGVRESPEQPGTYDLFFSTTSEAYNGPSPGPITVTGLTSGTINGAGIYRVQVTPTAGAPVVTSPQLIATGVRNAGGLAFHPETGDLYFTDNGLESASYNSADTLNVISADLLGAAVLDFGYPGQYVVYEDGTWVGTGDNPHSYAFTQEFSGVGLNELVLAPGGFPEALRNGWFFGFHGVWDQGGVDNPLNPILFFDGTSAQQFAAPGQSGVGHPIGLAAYGNSLYVADFNTQGGFSFTGGGVIYQISYVPEPRVGLGAAATCLLLALQRSRKVRRAEKA